MALAFGVLFEEFNSVSDSQNRLSGIVRNLAAEFLFEGHDEFDRIQAVGPKIIDEARALGHLLRLHAQVLHDDLLNPLANVTHRSNLMPFGWGSIGKAIRAVRGPRRVTQAENIDAGAAVAAVPNSHPPVRPRSSLRCRVSYFIRLGPVAIRLKLLSTPTL